VNLDITFSLPAILLSFTATAEETIEVTIGHAGIQLLRLKVSSLVVAPVLGANTVNMEMALDLPDYEACECFSRLIGKMNLTAALTLDIALSWCHSSLSKPVAHFTTQLSFPSFYSESKFAEPLGLGLRGFEIRFNNTLPYCLMHFLLFAIELVPEDTDYYYKMMPRFVALPNTRSCDVALAERIATFSQRHWNILPYAGGHQQCANPVRLFDFSQDFVCHRIFQELKVPQYHEFFTYLRCLYDAPGRLQDAAFLTLSHAAQSALPASAIYEFVPEIELLGTLRSFMSPSSLACQIRGTLAILVEPDFLTAGSAPPNVEPLMLRVEFISQREDVPGGAFSAFNCSPSWMSLTNLVCRTGPLHYEDEDEDDKESNLKEGQQIACGATRILPPAAYLVIRQSVPLHAGFRVTFHVILDMQMTLLSLLADRVLELQLFAPSQEDPANIVTLVALRWSLNPKSAAASFSILVDDVPLPATHFVSMDIPAHFFDSQVYIEVSYSTCLLLVRLSEPVTGTEVYATASLDVPTALGTPHAHIRLITSPHLSVSLFHFDFCLPQPDLNASRLLFLGSMPAPPARSPTTIDALGLSVRLACSLRHLRSPFPDLYFFQLLDSCRKPIASPTDLFTISFILSPLFLQSRFHTSETCQLAPSFSSLPPSTLPELARRGLVPFRFVPTIPGRYGVQVCLSPKYGNKGDSACTHIGSIYITIFT
jgi:hypothetical protein